ncbi:MAG: hypothetical protein IH947_12595 [Bacteroidetes bacterium]|nr:hypothetical protein [Bacteroidota bacterium]
MDIDPKDILVVEIDLDPENPKYLARGLGLRPWFARFESDTSDYWPKKLIKTQYGQELI